MGEGYSLSPVSAGLKDQMSYALDKGRIVAPKWVGYLPHEVSQGFHTTISGQAGEHEPVPLYNVTTPC